MATEDVERSLLDKKSYRHWTLSNGLAVLLISDPEVKVDHGNTRKRSRSDDGEEEEDEEEGQDDEDEDDMEGEDDDEDEGDDSDEGEEGEEEPSKKKKHEVQKKAAAAMCVGIGSFLDPPHMQGLSHYLEHMLFMGSTKYPDENEYDDFIQKHGGSSNAFTELEFTNYHFEIQPEALKETLDRFAQFFISPLCLEGSLEREVLAVDSEFQGVVQEDSCRVSQLICHTAVQGHIYQGFSWGNKKSLWDKPRATHVDIRSEILNHYKSHYSAERMSLVVLGGESLDTLASWVTDIFANLPVGKGPRVTFEGSGGPFEGQRLYVMPAVREKHEISLTFTLPSLFSHYAKKAEHYISHLVGHEGPGSLLSRLKREGWANEVCAGVEEDGHSQNTCCFLFSITITLTEAGLEAGPGLGLAVIGLVFEYLDLLRSSGPQEWIWREQKAIHEMKFRYQEEEDAMDFVTKLSSNMHLVSPKHALNSEFVHEEWDPALIQTLLDRMKPQGEAACYRIDLLTKSYDASKKQLEELAGPAIKTELEPWFDLEALSVEVPRSLSLSWSGSRSTTMHLPPVNPYVTSNFELKATPADVEADRRRAVEIQESNQLPALLSTPPVMICDEPGLRVWHKMDVTFMIPRACCLFRLSSPKLGSNPRNAAVEGLLLKLVEDAMNEDAYLADVAGLHYSIAQEGIMGIEIKVEGFSEKISTLLNRLFVCLFGASAKDFETSSFSREKEVLIRKLSNANIQVQKHASYSRLFALSSSANHVDSVVKELQTLQPSDIKDFTAQVLSDCHLESLVMGNLSKEEGLSICHSAKSILGGGCRLLASDRKKEMCIKLPLGPPLLFSEATKNPDEGNCGVEIYFQCCQGLEPKDRATIDLMDQIISEPCYNQLRTKEQLGYTVYSGMRLTHSVLGFCFGVVSCKMSSEEVEGRILGFIEYFANGKLEESLGEKEFESHKKALTSIKLQKDKALNDEVSRHWENVWNEREFLSKEMELKALLDLDAGTVREFFIKYLRPEASSRRLSIHIYPTKTLGAPSKGYAIGHKIIDNVQDWKSSQDLYQPAVRGV